MSQVFGEVGLFAARRGACRQAGSHPVRPVLRRRASAKDAVVVGEVAADGKGTVALRGPMVPRAAFPPGAERGGLPHPRSPPTALSTPAMRAAPTASAMIVTGPPPGIVSCGGYRFVVRDLQDLRRHPENGAGSLAVLPDALAGHRLAGTAADPDLVQRSLASSAPIRCWWALSASARVLRRDRSPRHRGC